MGSVLATGKKRCAQDTVLTKGSRWAAPTPSEAREMCTEETTCAPPSQNSAEPLRTALGYGEGHGEKGERDTRVHGKLLFEGMLLRSVIMLGGGNEGVGEKRAAQSSVCVIAWDRLEQPD